MSEKTLERRPQALAQPDNALANYLDSLLAEIGREEALPSLRQAVKGPDVEADTLLEEHRSREAEAIDSVAGTLSPPQWAESPFQILRVTLNRVNLVVPLQCLTGIMPFDGTTNRLPGQPAWSLGVAMNHDTKVVVADTHRLLMSEVEGEAPRYAYLLLIGEGDRGLAVDGIAGTTTIDKEAVRWRGRVATPPWYGGILVEELSVLLDVDGVLEMLA